MSLNPTPWLVKSYSAQLEASASALSSRIDKASGSIPEISYIPYRVTPKDVSAVKIEELNTQNNGFKIEVNFYCKNDAEELTPRLAGYLVPNVNRGDRTENETLILTPDGGITWSAAKFNNDEGNLDLEQGQGILFTSAVEGNKSSLYINNTLLSGTTIINGEANNCESACSNDGLIIGQSNNAIGTGQDKNSFYTLIGQNNDIIKNNCVVINGQYNQLSAFESSMMNGQANSARNTNFSIINGQANRLTNISYSLVAGNDNKLSADEADGNFNIVFGNSNNVADGNYDYVYGQYNTVKGDLNQVLGAGNLIVGGLNFAVGSGHKAMGVMNMELGVDNSALDGEGSILMGQKLISTAPYQIIMGAANDPNDMIKSIYSEESQCYNDPKTTKTVGDVNYVYPMFVLAGDSYPKEGGNRNSHTIYKDGQIMLRFDGEEYGVNENYPMDEVLINADYFKRASAVSTWVNNNSGVTSDISASIAQSAENLNNSIETINNKLIPIENNSGNYDNLVTTYGRNSADYSNIVSAINTYSSSFVDIKTNSDSNIKIKREYDGETKITTLYLSATGGGGEGEYKDFIFKGDASIIVSNREWNDDEGWYEYTLTLPEVARTQVSADDSNTINVFNDDNDVVRIGLSDTYINSANDRFSVLYGVCDNLSGTKLNTEVFNVWSASVVNSADNLSAAIDNLSSNRYIASAIYQDVTDLDNSKHAGYDNAGTFLIGSNAQINGSLDVWTGNVVIHRSESDANKIGPCSSSNDWTRMIKPVATDSNTVMTTDDIDNGIKVQVITSAEGVPIPTAPGMFTWVVESVEG